MLLLQLEHLLPKTLGQHLSPMCLLAWWDVPTGRRPLAPAFLSDPATKRHQHHRFTAQQGSVLPHWSPLGKPSIKPESNSDLKNA